MAATNRSSISSLSHGATSRRGQERNSSSAEEGIEITLNTISDCAIEWLKDTVFWNQFGRKKDDGYAKLLRLRKSETHLASWSEVLNWLKSPKLLNGADEGSINCEITRCHLRLFAQIRKEEVVFLLQGCTHKVKRP